LNTVERRKIKSGSSAAETGLACHSVNVSAAKASILHFPSHFTMALDAIDISTVKAATRLAAYLSPPI
jgi:hypothetical protein